MAYQKLLGTGTQALMVIPSDICDIPYPGNHIVSGTNTNMLALLPGPPGIAPLRDTTKNFIEEGVEIGDIVYERGNSSVTIGAGTVTSVGPIQIDIQRDDALTALWQPDFSTAVGTPYSIYKKGDYPCMLYFMKFSKFLTISVETAGGTSVGVFPGQPFGQFKWGPSNPYPSQVRKLLYNNTGMPFTNNMVAPADAYLFGLAVW